MLKKLITSGGAVLALMFIAGCDKQEPVKTAATAASPPPASASPAPEPAPTTAAAPVSTAEAAPPTAAMATTAAAAPSAGVLATAEGNWPGVRVEVLELKRTSGDSVTLKFAIVNDSDKAINMAQFRGDGYNEYRSVSGVYLLDGSSKQQYFVLKGADKKCLCSQGLDDVASKSRVNAWAKFAAPPADVQKIAVVVPRFIPLEDVPIGR